MTPRETDTQLYAIEIGGTWLSPSVQGTPINREAKLLLATYAFEELGVARLDCKTDARNERARRAIASFGASFEGILHNWQPSLVAGEESKYRDTAMYAITAEAWPTVRQELERRLYS
jgi:RimJ/RimL family protein N-acetyltransferase